jgi:hypothetical protein
VFLEQDDVPVLVACPPAWLPLVFACAFSVTPRFTA